MDPPAASDVPAPVRERQETVVRLGRSALETDDLDRFLAEATAAVAETLETEYCYVLERLPDGAEHLVREGVGWEEGVVGGTVSTAADSKIQRSSSAGDRRLVGDGRTVLGNDGSALLSDHDVEAGVVAIVGTKDRPWGVLGAFTTENRTFSDHERGFLRAVANLLASTIGTRQAKVDRDEIYGRISDAFFALDEEWRFTYLNEQAHELINPDGRNLVGTNVWDEFPAAIGRSFKPKYERAMYEQETVTFEEYYPEPLDAWFEVRAYPSESGLSVYFRDISERKRYERKLEQSEQRYRALAEHFPDGLVTLFDEDLRYTLAAGQAFEKFDFSAADVEGQSVHEVWGEETGDALEPLLRATLEGETPRVELTWGGREWAIHGVPITDTADDVFAGMTMARDVTEQKERERELRERKVQLEAATEAGAVGTFEWNVSEDRFVTGPQLAEKFGVDPDEVQDGVSLDRFVSAIHEDDLDRVEARIERALDECGEYEAEYRVYDADGDVRWVNARGHVECDGTGAPLTFPGTVTDVTERKGYQLQLQARIRQQEVVTDLGKQALAGDDIDRLMHEASAVVAETLDCEYCGVLDLLPSDDALRLRQGVGWDDGIVGEATVPNDDGSQARYTLASESAIVIDDLHTESRFSGPDLLTEHDVVSGISVVIGTVDAPWGILGVHATEETEFTEYDVNFVTSVANLLAGAIERQGYETELEATIDELTESNERLEQFAYAASHDLQEPLRMVSSYLRLIEQRYGDELDEDGEEFLAFAVDGADRMRSMIDGLLKYSRVETAGERPEPVDLEAVVADVCDDLSMKVEESDAEIAVGPLPTVLGDRRQLRQVFQNLLDNAMEYSGDDPPRVEVSAERRGSKVVVSVRDEGIGIDPEHADLIFDVFQSLHGPDEYGGTGIGLALCERIVERHGGDIWVESAPGEGATFSFTVPVGGVADA